jgi:hypothetical protein
LILASGGLLGTSSRGVGTLPGSLYFCMSSSFTGSCDRICCPFSAASLANQLSASANQCRATSLNAPLTRRSVLCVARCRASFPLRRYSSTREYMSVSCWGYAAVGRSSSFRSAAKCSETGCSRPSSSARSICPIASSQGIRRALS